MTETQTTTVTPLDATTHTNAILDGLATSVRDLLTVTTLPVHAYRFSAQGQSSIGAHVRHVLEFLQVLADQLADGVIDYESRAHNAAYESDPEIVAHILPQLHQTLATALETHGAYYPLLLRETVMVGGEKIPFTTSLGREILFMVQHAVHHLAIIRMQAAALNLAMDENFGVAVATKIYREQTHG